jgi:hypothetical protein
VSPRTRRSGFTITEVLVASVLMMIVFGLVLSLWLNTTRGVSKGEDTLDSIQDASIVLLYLRKDVQRMDRGPAIASWDIRYVRVRGNELTLNALKFDDETGGLKNHVTRTDNSNDTFKEDKTEVSFHVQGEDGEPVKVTYAFLPEQRSIRRVEGLKAPKYFALPRLQDFQVQLHYATRASTDRAIFGADTEATGELLQLWFGVRFSVQGDREQVDIRKTEVVVETRIFPRYLNRNLHTRWAGVP